MYFLSIFHYFVFEFLNIFWSILFKGLDKKFYQLVPLGSFFYWFITFNCLILQRHFSTQSQDDCEEDLFDSLEEPSSIKRSWSLLDVSIEVWLDFSNCDFVLIKLFICCLRCFPTSRFAVISLTLQFGAMCPFLLHLKHFIFFLSTFFEEKFWYVLLECFLCFDFL